MVNGDAKLVVDEVVVRGGAELIFKEGNGPGIIDVGEGLREVPGGVFQAEEVLRVTVFEGGVQSDLAEEAAFPQPLSTLGGSNTDTVSEGRKPL